MRTISLVRMCVNVSKLNFLSDELIKEVYHQKKKESQDFPPNSFNTIHTISRHTNLSDYHVAYFKIYPDA